MTSANPYETPILMTIYVNAIGFGYAIMKDPITVVQSQVIVVRPRPITNQNVLERIQELIVFFKPTLVVVEDYEGVGTRKSNRIKKLLDKVIIFVGEYKLPVKLYSRADIRFVFSNFNAHTKYEIASVISENIPYMKPFMIDRRKPYEAEKYTTGMFDAVSLGITHFYIEK